MNRGSPTSVTVNVSGSTRVSLFLEMLQLMDDPVLEREIMTDAVKMALSERIGNFDNMTVTPRHEKGGALTCDVAINLTELCKSIEAMQTAYNHILVHASMISGVLNEVRNRDTELTSVESTDDISPQTESGGSGKNAIVCPTCCTRNKQQTEALQIISELADQMLARHAQGTEKVVYGKSSEFSSSFSPVVVCETVSTIANEVNTQADKEDDQDRDCQEQDHEHLQRLGYVQLGEDDQGLGNVDGSNSEAENGLVSSRASSSRSAYEPLIQNMEEEHELADPEESEKRDANSVEQK